MLKKNLRFIVFILLGISCVFYIQTREPSGIKNKKTDAENDAVMETETAPLPESLLSPEIAQTPAEIPNDSDLVKVTDYIPQISVDLKYATEDNFTGQVIYEFQGAYLRYGTVKKLIEVCDELAEHGFSIKMWDGFRPAAAQFKLWEVCPDANYVANPNVKFSSHSRGNTMDITLIDLQGKEAEMPTGFDDFSAMADRDYSDCSETAANHAVLLQEIMEKHGFSGYFKEWWHYSDTTEYPAEESFNPAE